MNCEEDFIRPIIIISLFTLIVLSSCVNPFAPALDETISGEEGLITDQKTVSGVFQNFQYAYSFKDTTIYGDLLAKDFIFTYRDYDLGYDISWSRNEEMRVTHGLFQNAQQLDLIWNEIVSMTSDSTNIIRSFDLMITFNPTDIIDVDGRINLTLRKNEDNKWQITNWLDESNF